MSVWDKEKKDWTKLPEFTGIDSNWLEIEIKKSKTRMELLPEWFQKAIRFYGKSEREYHND